MRIVTAFRAFFAVLFRPDAARFIERVLEAGKSKPRQKKVKSAERANGSKVGRSGDQPTTQRDQPTTQKDGDQSTTQEDQSTAKASTVSSSKSLDRGRSDALTLLSTLQREARFLDLVQEPLDGFSDAQVGAAARDVIRDCGKVLDRCFSIKPLLTDDEGSRIGVSANASALRYRIVGKAIAEGQVTGRLVHPGWQAAQVQLPQWTGPKDDQLVLTPAEVEVS